MKWRIAVLVVLAMFAIGGFVAGWFLLKRPLEVWAWGTRRALTGAGLRRVVVESPVGRQVVFAGGSGPVVVLLHGAGDQAGTWFRVAPDLIKRYTVVIPDLAGHGDSAPSTGPISAAAVFGGIEAVIANQAGGRRVTVVGNSLGAWMAMLVAQRHPEWVERVVAINGGALKGANENARVLPKNRAEAREAMAQIRDAGSPPIPDYVLDDVIRQARVGSLARFAATADSMAAWVLSEEQLRAITAPVRLIWGASDTLMPLEYARRVAAALGGVELVTIDRCGHMPQQECPDRLLAALRGALGEVPAGNPPSEPTGVAR